MYLIIEYNEIPDSYIPANNRFKRQQVWFLIIGACTEIYQTDLCTKLDIVEIVVFEFWQKDQQPFLYDSSWESVNEDATNWQTE